MRISDNSPAGDLAETLSVVSEEAIVEPPRSQRLTELEALFKSTLVERFEHMRHRVGREVEELDVTRRCTERLSCRRDGIRAACAEVCLDVLVDDAVAAMRKELGTDRLWSPVTVCDGDRARIQERMQRMLRASLRASVRQNGCEFYDGLSAIGEYENALVLEDKKPTFLFLDATLGKGANKLGKVRRLRSAVFDVPHNERVDAMAILFRGDEAIANGWKVTLPADEAIDALYGYAMRLRQL
ncbi:MAG: hypothetical protein Greene041619_367 [Candidatus Peregrinibacteria bacterium Greene0416_19]|nr:MAG: hypothetical protein Greene041619_367 [Candidatus Peregrinibacteria bacterium Greene0416_19]